MNIPILMYHNLETTQSTGYPYSLAVDQFARHLTDLQRWGYETISFHELFGALQQNKRLPPRPVIITFDDAYVSVADFGVPMLKERGMKATVFVVADAIGAHNDWDVANGLARLEIMDERMIKEAMAAGWEIGSHGCRHLDLTKASPADQQDEIQRSRQQLEHRFGQPIEVFAYPYGSHTLDLPALLQRAGYNGAVSIFSGASSVTSDPYRMRRVYPHRGDSPWRFRCKLSRLYLQLVAWRDRRFSRRQIACRTQMEKDRVVLDRIDARGNSFVAGCTTSESIKGFQSSTLKHRMVQMIESSLQHSVRFVPWSLRTAVKRVPIISQWQRRILFRLLEGREFIHTVDAGPAKGLVYPVVLPADKGVWTGTYELDFVERLAASVKPGDVCFDVGGWRGYCAGVMACSGAARTIVFEPLEANAMRIGRLIELNPGLSITLQPVAVGDNDGCATFHLMPDMSMGKLGESPFQPAAVPSGQVSVSLVTLDTFCDTNGIDTVNVIKVDTEGAEMLVLRGAERLLRRCRPHLFVEAHSRELASGVTDFLRPLGYEVTVVETGAVPDGKSEPEVCHLQAIPICVIPQQPQQ